MESWSYVSGGKVFASDESVSASDAVARSKNGLVDWVLRTPCSYGNSMVCSGQEFGELGFPELMRKSLPADTNKDVLRQKINGGRMFSSVIAIPNAFSGEDESSPKLSSSVGESNYRDSLLIDLKLGGFGDHGDSQNFSSSRITPNLSSTESTAPTKRVRTGGLSTFTHYCQVYGCKKDLSSSKDYHKRHKVCEVHSKTAKVIVNGTEQRFCQQCSRFHLLAEFDDGKRSCRKRLAGHNERRRKPHVGGRSWRLFQKYNDMKYQGTPFAASSFSCPDVLPCNLLHSQKCDANNWSRRIKLEDNPDYFPQSVTSFTNAHLHHRFPFLSCDFGNQYSPLHDKGIHTAAAGQISERNQFPHDMASSNSATHSFFQSTSMVSGNQIIFDAASSLQGLSETSDSGCALSLLSSQLHNSSRHLPGIPMAHSLITPSSHSHYNVIPVSDKLLGVTTQNLARGGSNKLHSSGLNSAENIHLDSFIISDNSNAVNFGMNGLLQGSEYMNAKDRFSSEVDPTINLIQLSSQLHRVEHERQSLVTQK